MYNRFMKTKELNVTIGDRVSVNGCYGTVTEVFKGVDAENNEPYTSVRVKFDANEYISSWGQYQNKVYGCFAVIRS